MPGRPQGAERGRPVFRDPFGEGREVFRRRPRVVGGGAALLAYQVVGPAAQDRSTNGDRPRGAVGSGARIGWVWLGRARMVGPEPVDVDRGTALAAARQGQSIRVRAGDGRHRKGALPPRAQPAHLGGVQQHLVAHLEGRIHVNLGSWSTSPSGTPSPERSAISRMIRASSAAVSVERVGTAWTVDLAEEVVDVQSPTPSRPSSQSTPITPPRLEGSGRGCNWPRRPT